MPAAGTLCSGLVGRYGVFLQQPHPPHVSEHLPWPVGMVSLGAGKSSLQEETGLGELKEGWLFESC